ncbi:MAG: type II toxin-antitoxin system PemK/MazF family toxin [Gemmataceae bacterium]
MTRGDVVEVDWYFTDMTGFKRRPAVVVQNDALNGLLDDTVLVQITGTRHGISDTEVFLDPAVETASGLTKPCVASCLNVTTYEQARVHRTVGYLSDAAMREIARCLKAVMELP